MFLNARYFGFEFPRPALVMGVVNVTPDSFSDGGRFFEPSAATDHALALAKAGADIVDIGGESTRPGAEPVAEAEELRRVLPVLERLAGQLTIPISIDTMKPAVARAALEAGACIINDVGAHEKVRDMWELAAEAQAGYVCVHCQGTPQTMQSNPAYTDVATEVCDFLAARVEKIYSAGLPREHIILDPGIGFGKTSQHNLALLAAMEKFTAIGRPVLVGVSRKSFLGEVVGAPLEQRLPAALACATLAVEAGASIVRVHDVAETVQAIRMAEAIVAKRPRAMQP